MPAPVKPSPSEQTAVTARRRGRTLIFSVADEITPDTLLSVFDAARDGDELPLPRASSGISVVAHGSPTAAGSEAESRAGVTDNPITSLIDLCSSLQRTVQTLTDRVADL